MTDKKELHEFVNAFGANLSPLDRKDIWFWHLSKLKEQEEKFKSELEGLKKRRKHIETRHISGGENYDTFERRRYKAIGYNIRNSEVNFKIDELVKSYSPKRK